MRIGAAQKVALGGVLAALATVIMSFGGLIPLSTYICPMICTVLCYVVLRLCGKRIAWAWYAVVSILSVLLGPDKEAAGVFVFFGFYPIVKELFDKFRLRFVLKIFYFNASASALYFGLIYVFGFSELMREIRSMGAVGLAVMLLLANLTFLLSDRLLCVLSKRL